MTDQSGSEVVELLRRIEASQQSQIRNVVLPVVALLIGLLVYLLFRWRMVF